MANNINKNKILILEDLTNKLFEHLKSTLDRYMKDFPKHEELISIMANENQLYDAEGKPSKEYMDLINEFDNYCVQNPFNVDEIAKEDDFDSIKLEILNGAKDFIEKQRELMVSYNKTTDKENWHEQKLDSEEKRHGFDKIVEEMSNDALNDLDVEK